MIDIVRLLPHQDVDPLADRVRVEFIGNGKFRWYATKQSDELSHPGEIDKDYDSSAQAEAAGIEWLTSQGAKRIVVEVSDA